MRIEVSNGELLDKVSILYIKKQEVKDYRKLSNINKEWEYLKAKKDLLFLKIPNLVRDEVVFLYGDLQIINHRLWRVEDELRKFEKEKNFGDNFIRLAREVYITNDERSRVKNKINLLTESKFIEEKSY